MKIRVLSPGGRGVARVQVRCPQGLEALLQAELAAQGCPSSEAFRGGVGVDADVRTAAAICHRSRLASRVLWPLASFEAGDGDALYAGAAQVDWARYVRGLPTLAVGFDGVSDALRNTHYSEQRIKDAIVDALRDARGDRPAVDTRDPQFAVQGVLHRGRVTLMLDLAGAPLHRRGWRQEQGAAPLKENLAAGLLLAGGWCEGRREWLVDPCCGAGTLLVEGALIAAGIAPGVLRARFGFEAWTGADEGLRAELDASVPEPSAPVRLRGRDIDGAQIERCRRNLERAGAGSRFEVDLDLAVGDVHRGVPAQQGDAFVACNPPYGHRLDADGVLPALGRALRACPGAELALVVAEAASPWGRPERAGAAAADPAQALRLQLDLPGLSSRAVRNGALDAWFLTGRADDDDVDTQAFVNRLRKNRRRLERFADRIPTDAVRLYDRDLPEFALVVDRYGDAVVVQEFRAPKTIDPVLAARRRDAALAALPAALELPADAIRFRERRRQTGDDGYGVHARTGARRALREAQARLLVNLDDYLDTGLYLDSRGVRRRIAEHFERAGGGRLLNLFAYTCTATVRAALAGATSSVSVDRSRTYLDWGEANLEANGLNVSDHELVRADVLPWLEGPARDAGSFDRILLDPPTFSNSSDDDDLDLQRDHGRLLKAALRALAPGGALLFVVHARRFSLDANWAEHEAYGVEEITRWTLDEDCARGRPAHRCWQFTRR